MVNMNEYITRNYNSIYKMFLGFSKWKLYYTTHEEIEDLFGDMILSIINSCQNKTFTNDTACYNYISVAIRNKVINKIRKKKNMEYTELIDNISIDEEYKEDNIFILYIDEWCDKNLGLWENGLFKMWYRNEYTYDELSQLTTMDKTYIFNTVKGAKEKIRQQFGEQFKDRDNF